MSKHKKQHFIPACYTKAWRDPDAPETHTPYVWLFDKDGSNPRNKAPENVFHETDLYTIISEDGSRDLRLEKGLCQLEYEFTKVRNSKINFRRELSEEDRIILCAFAAATHARTPTIREHYKKQWEHPLRMIEEMQAKLDSMTNEEKEEFLAKQPPSFGSNSASISYEEIKLMHKTPLQTMMFPIIETTTPLLYKLDLALLVTDDEIGFITSDHPCVWFDSQSYRRPPMYRQPALMYETIEITIPISPNCAMLLNRQNINGYINASQRIVTEMNRRTRGYASEYFVVRRNHIEPQWLETRVEPEDSWEKMKKTKAAKERSA